MPPDPIARFRRWYREASPRADLPDACALATATRDGRPSVRYVLLKGVDARGFVFFTDVRSRKGAELRANPRAALAFYWHPTGRQVRVEGRVREVGAAEADAYWATRPRESQLSAWASRQSAPIARRRDLKAALLRLKARSRGAALPRPPYWRGFRLAPEAIEFWIRGAYRLHFRERFRRRPGGRWRRELLQP
jgi:pyridoxamine 5'-phosphate oxidase